MLSDNGADRALYTPISNVCVCTFKAITQNQTVKQNEPRWKPTKHPKLEVARMYCTGGATCVNNILCKCAPKKRPDKWLLCQVAYFSKRREVANRLLQYIVTWFFVSKEVAKVGSVCRNGNFEFGIKFLMIFGFIQFRSLQLQESVYTHQNLLRFVCWNISVLCFQQTQMDLFESRRSLLGMFFCFVYFPCRVPIWAIKLRTFKKRSDEQEWIWRLERVCQFVANINGRRSGSKFGPRQHINTEHYFFRTVLEVLCRNAWN